MTTTIDRDDTSTDDDDLIPAQDDDDLIPAQEAATMLAVRVGTLAAWRHRRQGPPWVQLTGRTPRYSRRQITEWVARRTRTGGGAL